MDYSNILDILHYKDCKDKNLEKQMEKLYKICNSSLNEIIEDSFQSGFEQGMEYGRSDENFKIRCKIIGKLLINTNLTNDDIFKIVGFGEEKWKENIVYLRKKYEQGLIEGKSEILIKQLIKKFKKVPEEYIQKIKTLPLDTIDIIALEILDIESIKDLKKYFNLS